MATYTITTSIPTSIVTGDILNCPYKGSAVSLTLPKGQYKLECWGAQGGTYSSYLGGYGGYSVGTITLANDTLIYCYVGGQPASIASGKTTVPGGFNGGGNGQNRSYSGTYMYGQGGGGGTDIRIGQDSLYARVIVAGGGGGSASVDAATTKYGGGLTSGSPTSTYVATQSASTTSTSGFCGFGVGGNASTSGASYKYGSGGGGGGWYGGGAWNSYSDTTSAGRGYNGGGSGYVYALDTAVNYPSGCLLTSEHYLADAQTIAGNITITRPDGTSATGNTGNGYIRITAIKVGEALPVYVKVDSIWHQSTAMYSKVNGVWVPAAGIKSKVNDTWYPYEPPRLEDYSWEEISAISYAGNAATTFALGDTKTFVMDGNTYTAQIIGFDHDDAAWSSYGKTKVGITFSVVELVSTTATMNATATNVGGWKDSVMRNTTLPNILTSLPTELQNVIVEVSKYSTIGNQSSTVTNTIDKLFLLSQMEATGSTSYSGGTESSTQYEYYAQGGSIVKSYRYWLRSANINTSTGFVLIYTSGAAGSLGATSGGGLPLNFCV